MKTTFKLKLNGLQERLILVLFVIFYLANVMQCSNEPSEETFYLQNSADLCPVGYFQCNSSSQCVGQRLNCDGIADCNDGSDEWKCDDDVDSLFWDHLFRKQPYGRSDNKQIGTCAWLNLNVSCPCRDNEILCRNQNLNNLPENLPNGGIAMLDLTGNNFPIITDNFFKDIPQVEILVLKFCSIQSIEPNAFQSFPKIFLETLHLDENRIETIPENLFPPKNLLKTLILSGNRIRKLHFYDFANLDLLQELDLRDNRIESISADVLHPLKSLQILYLNGNRLQQIEPGMFPTLRKLSTLSLAHNRIERFEIGSFNMPILKYLFLSGNRLVELKDHVFCGLSKLKGLNLDNNRISRFGNDSFACLDDLTSLFLTDNTFKTLDNQVLINLTSLNYIYFSWFHLCRAALHVRVCEPKGDGISSAHHLLDNPVLRASVWVMASIAVIGNLVVLFGRFFQKSRTHVEHSLYLRHLAASDLIMGIYLTAIAVADIIFRGEYIIHEQTWRESVACAICGFLSTLSCQSSTLLLTLVTWDRLVSVTQPLQPRTTGKGMLAFRLMVLWSASICAAAAPFSSTEYFGKHFYGNNGVCLSLHIHDPYAKGWEYSAGLFIIINAFSLTFIICSYLRMLQAIRGSTGAMRSTVSGRENVVARRFAIIVGTDCVCWLPIIVVKLAALSGMRISPSLYAWLAVLVLPVNSALNPILYTLTTASFKQQVRKYFKAMPSCSTQPESRSQTAFETGLSMSLNHIGNGSGKRRLLQKQMSYV